MLSTDVPLKMLLQLSSLLRPPYLQSCLAQEYTFPNAATCSDWMIQSSSPNLENPESNFNVQISTLVS